MTEAGAVDFIMLYVNYFLNQNVTSSIETKVVKLNIEVNKLN